VVTTYNEQLAIDITHCVYVCVCMCTVDEPNTKHALCKKGLLFLTGELVALFIYPLPLLHRLAVTVSTKFIVAFETPIKGVLFKFREHSPYIITVYNNVRALTHTYSEVMYNYL